MNKMIGCLSLGLGGLILAACQKAPPLATPAPAGPARTPLPAAEALPPKAPPVVNNIDDYKLLVAQQILDANPDIIFSGRLPPMLPAIVVVNIGVTRDGELSSVTVKRSRNAKASTVALAAVKKVGAPFPKPLHLLGRGHKTLDFSETFLFNDQFKFQLRTLAGPQ